MPEQKKREPNKFAIVDEELLGNKESKKIFRQAAYSMGLGVGFLLLIPLLPSIDDKEKMEGMEGIYRTISLSMIAYSLSLAFGFFLLRPYIKLVLFVLNWLVMPVVGIWCITEGYKVITHE